MVLVVFRTIRNHWKKSLFAASVSTWAAHHFYTKHEINQLMKGYCLEARNLGQTEIEPFQACQHVTVILNPEANGRKSKKQFEQFVAPILHLAGIRVSIFETEAPGQAQELMHVMDNTDGVLVAGGDGTLHEVITGWLQRCKSQPANKPIAICALPLGKQSRSFKLLNQQLYQTEAYQKPFWQSNKVREAQILAEQALRVARNQQRQANVMQIDFQQEQTSLYALNSFEFGQMAHLTTGFAKYWYLGKFLGQYLSLARNTFWKTLDDLVLCKQMNFQYTQPCSGCSKCYQTFERPEMNVQQVQPQSSWAKWLGFGSSRTKQTETAEQLAIKKMKTIHNDQCGQVHQLQVDDILNLRIQNDTNTLPNKLILRYSQKQTNQSKLDFFGHVRNYAQTTAKHDHEQEVIVRSVAFDLPVPEAEVQQTSEQPMESSDEIGSKHIAQSPSESQSSVSRETDADGKKNNSNTDDHLNDEDRDERVSHGDHGQEGHKQTPHLSGSQFALLRHLKSQDDPNGELYVDSERYKLVANILATSLPARLTLYQ